MTGFSCDNNVLGLPGGETVATAIWVKTIRHHRTDRQTTVPCTRSDPYDALNEACHQLDLPQPLWLDKNHREWEEFGQTRFLLRMLFFCFVLVTRLI